MCYTVYTVHPQYKYIYTEYIQYINLYIQYINIFIQNIFKQEIKTATKENLKHYYTHVSENMTETKACKTRLLHSRSLRFSSAEGNKKCVWQRCQDQDRKTTHEQTK